MILNIKIVDEFDRFNFKIAYTKSEGFRPSADDFYEVWNK